MTGTSCYCFKYDLHFIKIPSHVDRESIRFYSYFHLRLNGAYYTLAIPEYPMGWYSKWLTFGVPPTMHRSSRGSRNFLLMFSLCRINSTTQCAQARPDVFVHMFTSISTMLFCAVLLSCLECSSGHQEENQIQKPVQFAGEKVTNHGCPSWFIPVSNDSNHCKCGEPIHHPGRIVLCDPNTKQTLLLTENCMDYNGL